jgi:hypothetical protein
MHNNNKHTKLITYVIGIKIRINNVQNFNNKYRPAIMTINRSKFKKAKILNNEVQVKNAQC